MRVWRGSCNSSRCVQYRWLVAKCTLIKLPSRCYSAPIDQDPSSHLARSTNRRSNLLAIRNQDPVLNWPTFRAQKTCPRVVSQARNSDLFLHWDSRDECSDIARKHLGKVYPVSYSGRREHAEESCREMKLIQPSRCDSNDRTRSCPRKNWSGVARRRRWRNSARLRSSRVVFIPTRCDSFASEDRDE